MTINRRQKQIKAFVKVLREKLERKNRYKDIAEFVRGQHDDIIVMSFFQKWKRKFTKRKASEPTKNYASSFYATKLKR